ncbi:hypothetical protein [Gloeobacter kilaueensis]|uniref:Uncharacterized protein n=1 Tax=Gloeobacter kilaueensis (strain ATCC BAA-2537 / CCAP 1431/1 / ULC 316 / JS1) TaxID=1183438 RepID=U5QGA7_GLOK1|nr:hypothetical protein [Gloeobacter kilaueensis]AGY58002.1 hypothetical protein GKIL_1756 [Gloeobacter kilaueensis JS1]
MAHEISLQADFVHWISNEQHDSFFSQQPLFVDTERAFFSAIGASDLSRFIPVQPFDENGNGLGVLKTWYGYTNFIRFGILVYPSPAGFPHANLVPALDDVSGWSTVELLNHFSFLPKLFFDNIFSISPYIPDGSWVMLTRKREKFQVLRSSDQNGIKLVADVLNKLSGDNCFYVERSEASY